MIKKEKCLLIAFSTTNLIKTYRKIVQDIYTLTWYEEVKFYFVITSVEADTAGQVEVKGGCVGYLK